MFDMTLSGPQRTEGDLRMELVRLGATVKLDPQSHGLPDHTDGSAIPDTAWLECLAPDLDQVVVAAARFEWVLRMHTVLETP